MTPADEPEPMEINQVSWDHMISNPKCQLEWTRRDYGTTRLMLPGKRGPLDRRFVFLSIEGPPPSLSTHKTNTILLFQKIRMKDGKK